MDIRGISKNFQTAFFSFVSYFRVSLIFVFIVSAYHLPSQNRNQHERSFLFHLPRNLAYNHQFLQSDRLLQYSWAYLAVRSDKERSPVNGNPSAPVPVVYAVSFLTPVIYFPYAVLLSHRFLFRKYPDRFLEKTGSFRLSYLIFCPKWNCLMYHHSKNAV